MSALIAVALFFAFTTGFLVGLMRGFTLGREDHLHWTDGLLRANRTCQREETTI